MIWADGAGRRGAGGTRNGERQLTSIDEYFYLHFVTTKRFLLFAESSVSVSGTAAGVATTDTK